VHQGLRRAPSAELLRGVFDAALSVYLDRFLNVPPESIHVLVAAARYLAAHAPTMRAEGQTYQIAHRLHRRASLRRTRARPGHRALR